jgi:hypothetical protein
LVSDWAATELLQTSNEVAHIDTVQVLLTLDNANGDLSPASVTYDFGLMLDAALPPSSSDGNAPERQGM